MTKSRCTREYIDGCRLFVDFAVRNCTISDGKIHCSCKACRNNQHYLPSFIRDHLTRGKGILTTYKNWYYHREKPIQLAAAVSNLTTRA